MGNSFVTPRKHQPAYHPVQHQVPSDGKLVSHEFNKQLTVKKPAHYLTQNKKSTPFFDKPESLQSSPAQTSNDDKKNPGLKKISKNVM
jgi:hypothetical protein